MKKFLGFFVVLIALLAFNNTFAQTANTGQSGKETKPACHKEHASCAGKAAASAQTDSNAEQGSAKMVEAGGVSPDAKPACANKSAACCKDKKGTANAEQGSSKMVAAGGVSPDAKPACAGKSAACCKDKKGTANAGQGSTKMVAAGGVSPDAKPACCKDKKSAASCDKEKKAENTTTPQE
ncbi:hypothetical protein C7N43_36960 [Sphingobacteriales bacterium UPWRP_1]|nr:hypothetical protein BVG80_11050 [Sphingobacteriales bacterium TSM_CSM]PSJ71906.1 hypothetical protein C7N43_36960 [Sphingobacteriales bacterium UPWRP_1]